MYTNFEEARAAAMNVINKKYDGDKMGCVITENKSSAKARKTWYGFHFYDKDINGEFVQLEYGSYSRMTAI